MMKPHISINGDKMFIQMWSPVATSGQFDLIVTQKLSSSNVRSKRSLKGLVKRGDFTERFSNFHECNFLLNPKVIQQFRKFDFEEIF